MKKALLIVGPTSSGKTDLAVKIAQKYPFELIGADSVQVYKGCDIISGKDHPKDVRIHMTDIASPFTSYSVSDFVKQAKLAVNGIKKNNNTPLIVGGTGFYADALFRDIETINIPPDIGLRFRLEKKTLSELQDELRDINSTRFLKMNESDVRNPRRLIRAIEISENRKKSTISVPVFKPEEILIIGLRIKLHGLKKKIEERVEKRLQMGAMGEAERLYMKYHEISKNIKTASGYRQLFNFLSGEISFNDAKTQWILSDYHLAKKQMTWFAKNQNIKWFDIEETGFETKILKLIEQNFTSN